MRKGNDSAHIVNSDVYNSIPADREGIIKPLSSTRLFESLYSPNSYNIRARVHIHVISLSHNLFLISIDELVVKNFPSFDCGSSPAMAQNYAILSLINFSGNLHSNISTPNSI